MILDENVIFLVTQGIVHPNSFRYYYREYYKTSNLQHKYLDPSKTILILIK